MIPDVTGLVLDEIRNTAGFVYMRRYYINGLNDRYHEILLSDDQDFHDHPWHFTSEILHGTYIEHTPQGSTVYSEGDVIRRQAHDVHRLELTDPVWTHVLTGPFMRTWGFHTPTGWVDHHTYLGTTPKRHTRRPSRAW
jgi:hypothetical protein